MLPWTSRKHAGFPSEEYVKASCVSQLLEDLPLLIIQLVAASRDGFASPVTNLSITLTAVSLVTKGLSKVSIRAPRTNRFHRKPDCLVSGNPDHVW